MRGNLLRANPVLRQPFPDSLRLDLSKHGQYRVAVWPGKTQVRIAPAAHADRVEFAPRIREGGGATPTTIELHPQDDGPHFIVVTPTAGTDLVRVWVWEDTTGESATRTKHERQWSVGLSAAFGVVSGYEVHGANLPPDVSRASRYFEGAAVIGSGSSLSVELGFGYDPRPAVDSISLDLRILRNPSGVSSTGSRRT